MKIICTTSDRYLHLIPVFCYLFRKYWGNDPVEIVGYDEPRNLPEGFTFHSMGKQGDVSEWSTDLRKYFKTQPQWFVWLMEDTFIKSFKGLNVPANAFRRHTGRIDLTRDVQNRPHRVNASLVVADHDTNYRLSTQPSIWNRDYLLQYLTPGLTPWQFEVQDAHYDGWDVLGLIEPPLRHNEGVRKHNIHLMDFNGFPQEDLDHIKTLRA